MCREYISAHAWWLRLDPQNRHGPRQAGLEVGSSLEGASFGAKEGANEGARQKTGLRKGEEDTRSQPKEAVPRAALLQSPVPKIRNTAEEEGRAVNHCIVACRECSVPVH